MKLDNCERRTHHYLGGKNMNKEKFIEIYNANIKRDGADQLLKWLEESDFFAAPASTKFHMSREGGLMQHSINVWQRLKSLVYDNRKSNKHFSHISDETIAICGLLHDLCKVNIYIRGPRGYYTDDQFSYGHGEKSVYIINEFLRLTQEEALAIRWHMGGFDAAANSGSWAMSNAWNKYPFCPLLHIADMEATYIDELEDE